MYLMKSMLCVLTHWGRMTHMYTSCLSSIAHQDWLWLHRSNNNVIPDQAWTNKQGQVEGHTADSSSSGRHPAGSGPNSEKAPHHYKISLLALSFLTITTITIMLLPYIWYMKITVHMIDPFMLPWKLIHVKMIYTYFMSHQVAKSQS